MKLCRPRFTQIASLKSNKSTAVHHQHANLCRTMIISFGCIHTHRVSWFDANDHDHIFFLIPLKALAFNFHENIHFFLFSSDQKCHQISPFWLQFQCDVPSGSLELLNAKFVWVIFRCIMRFLFLLFHAFFAYCVGEPKPLCGS